MIDYSWHQQLQENASTNAAAAAASLYFSDILLPNILKGYKFRLLDFWLNFLAYFKILYETNRKSDNVKTI